MPVAHLDKLGPPLHLQLRLRLRLRRQAGTEVGCANGGLASRRPLNLGPGHRRHRRWTSEAKQEAREAARSVWRTPVRH